MPQNQASQPRLTPATAAEIISHTPQFYKSRQLVKVNRLIRGRDEFIDCCYTVKFTFRENGTNASRSLVEADGILRYWKGKWHLQFIEPSDLTDPKLVWIGPPGARWPISNMMFVWSVVL